MTESKKESIIQAVKEMQAHLKEAKEAAGEAARSAWEAKDAAYEVADSVKDAEAELRYLTALLDEEVRS